MAEPRVSQHKDSTLHSGFSQKQAQKPIEKNTNGSLHGNAVEEESSKGEKKNIQKMEQPKNETQERKTSEKALLEDCYDAIDYLCENIGQLADMYASEIGFSTESQAIRNAWNRAAKLKAKIHSSSLQSSMSECVTLAERLQIIEKEWAVANQSETKNMDVNEKETILKNISDCKIELVGLATALSSLKEEFPNKFVENRINSKRNVPKENKNAKDKNHSLNLLQIMTKFSGCRLSRKSTSNQNEIDDLFADLDKMKLNFDDPLDAEEDTLDSKITNSDRIPFLPQWPDPIHSTRRSRYNHNSLCRSQRLWERHNERRHRISQRSEESNRVNELRNKTDNLVRDLNGFPSGSLPVNMSKKWSNFNLALAKEARQEFDEASKKYGDCILSCKEDGFDSTALEATVNLRRSNCLIYQCALAERHKNDNMGVGILPDVINSYTQAGTINSLSDSPNNDLQATAHLGLARSYLKNRQYTETGQHSAIAFNLAEENTNSMKIEARLATASALWETNEETAAAFTHDIQTKTLELIAPWFKKYTNYNANSKAVENLDKDAEEMWAKHLRSVELGELLGDKNKAKQKKSIRKMFIGRALVAKQKHNQLERERKLADSEKARLAAEKARSPAQIKVEVRGVTMDTPLSLKAIFIRFSIEIAQFKSNGEKFMDVVSTGKVNKSNNHSNWDSETGTVSLAFPGVEIGHLVSADEGVHPQLSLEACYKDNFHRVKVFGKSLIKLPPYLYCRDQIQAHKKELDLLKQVNSRFEVDFTTYIKSADDAIEK